MKLAFSSNAFRRFSIEETIALVAEAGYAGVELMADTPHAFPPQVTPEKLESIRKAAERSGMGISNINAFMMCGYGKGCDFHHPSWIEPDPSFRRIRIEHTKRCLQIAAAVGARHISTEPGGPLPEGMTREAALAIFRDGLEECLPVAARTGVEILIEPEPGLLLETSRQFADFMVERPLSHVAMNGDLGHFFCVSEEPHDVIRSGREWIRHVHLEDIAADRKHVHLEPGQGAMNFHAIFEALREIRYGGWVTVELYPYQEDPAGAARRARQHLSQFLHA